MSQDAAREGEKPDAVRNGRNIVICMDGTGNEFGNENSNVVKLYSVLNVDDQQLAYYRPGVGTMGSPSARGPIEKRVSMWMGLAFGAGLLPGIGDAYRYLINNFKENDNLYIFGFSRGAYAARALGGVLQAFGLLCPGNEQMIPYILRMYAQHTREKRGMENTPGGTDQNPEKPEWKQFKWTYSRSDFKEIHFLGVWDTVSSIGWIYDPIVLPFAGDNPIIAIGRQALALDERRTFYSPRLWSAPQHGQDIKQVWFRGVHSDIGGSYSEETSGPSKIALEWMLMEAERAGLRINKTKAEYVLGKTQPPKPLSLPTYISPDPNTTRHQSLTGAWRLVEALPHKDTDADPQKAKSMSRWSIRRWSIPLGQFRTVPTGSRIHTSVYAADDQGKLNSIPQGCMEEKAECYFPGTGHCAYLGKLPQPAADGLFRAKNPFADRRTQIARAAFGLGVAAMAGAGLWRAWHRA